MQANAITDFELIDRLSSVNPAGFESIVIDKDTDDESYYLIIRFVEGSMDAEVYLHLGPGTAMGLFPGEWPQFPSAITCTMGQLQQEEIIVRLGCILRNS